MFCYSPIRDGMIGWIGVPGPDRARTGLRANTQGPGPSDETFGVYDMFLTS